MRTNSVHTVDPETEKELLGNVPGIEDDVVEETQVEDGEQQDEEAPPEPAEPEQQDEETREQPEQQSQRPKFDKDGNVVDARGNVIAKAGRERRLDEQNKRLKHVLLDHQKEISRLRAELAGGQVLNNAPARLGLSQDEVAIGLDLVQLFKSNPEQAVTTIVGEAIARGVDLNKVLGNTNAINTKAITTLLDQRLGPIHQRIQSEEREQQALDAAGKRYNSFLATYPDAAEHQGAIAKLMRDGKASNEEVGYFMLKEFAARNGLDFNQPLGPQIAAVIQSGQQAPQQQRQKPLLNGRNLGRQATERNKDVASPNRTYGSIVEEALNEAGIL